VGGLEEALLHGGIVNIETKRMELEGKNVSRNEIRKSLSDQYRVFSRKQAFTCPCCDEPVNMNLTVDDGRPFYFKHLDGKKCTYSENSKTYDRQVSTHQDKKKKDIGLTVFKEILEGQLKPYGIIERGYFYKKKLSFIPDFIVKFPFTNDVWAIDYYTSISQGTYTHNLAKRMKTYQAEGFKVFSYIDDYWLAINAETDKGTLLNAEMFVSNKSNEDQRWDQYINQDLSRDELQFLKAEVAGFRNSIDTKSIAYVNIENRTCKIIRFLEAEKNNHNLTFYKLSEPTIPLERALTLNSQLNDFLLYRENEEELRQTFKQSLMDKLKQAEAEEKAQLEALKQLQREEEAKKAAIEKQRIEAEERSRLYHEMMRKSEEQVEIEMLQRAKAASERPVGMSPDTWEWYKKREIVFHSSNNYIIKTQPIASVIETKGKPVDKEREKFKEKLLSYPIKGDNFINGAVATWRSFILKWVKNNQHEDTLTVSMTKLLYEMREAGISFNQKDAIVQYPVKEFLVFYQSALKKDLKRKIEIIFLN
jgi:hypothetical protein